MFIFNCASIAHILRPPVFRDVPLWNMQTEEQARESHANQILYGAYIAACSLSLAPAHPARSRSSSSVIIIYRPKVFTFIAH